MAMSPLVCSILGLDSGRRRRRSDAADEDTMPTLILNMPELRPPRRQSRRTTSYHNSFQTSCTIADDSPPNYVNACRWQPRPTRLSVRPSRERLPKYSSTVNAEAKLLVNIESINPLQGVVESVWKEVYVVLRGTLLSFHKVKDGKQGKLLRHYTLQHAEVGLATDVTHTILIPQTRFAHFIPVAARQRMWQRDPDMFKPVVQTILRIRAETDQFLLAGSSEDEIFQLILKISAAIDISPPIDERSIPKQCTVPRRRRRPRQVATNDISNPSLLAQQQRLFQNMYPGFAEIRVESGAEPQPHGNLEPQQERPESMFLREEDDLDLSMIREELTPVSSTVESSQHPALRRPHNRRQTTATSVTSNFSDEMIYATAPENFNSAGKWQPPNHRTPAQMQRYIKRCMPVLLADAPRASDVLISNGKRVRVNWRRELLDDWELQPPTYRSHGFVYGSGLERIESRGSASGSSAEPADVIVPLEQSFNNGKLSKSNSVNTNLTTSRRRGRRNMEPGKARSQMNPDSSGVVFYF